MFFHKNPGKVSLPPAGTAAKRRILLVIKSLGIGTLATVLFLSIGTFFYYEKEWEDYASAYPTRLPYILSYAAQQYEGSLLLQGIREDNIIYRAFDWINESATEAGIRQIPESDGER